MNNDQGGTYRGLRYLEMGVCRRQYNSRTPPFCALTKDDCISSETFEPHVQDEETKDRCNPNDYVIGRCVLENTCALRASDCEVDQSDSNFRSSRFERNPCTIQRDKSIWWDIENPTYTQFGSCKNTVNGEYFCIYDPKDCDESGTDVYATPAETLAAGVVCDCSNVHVWACRTGRYAFCAVGEFSFGMEDCIASSPLSQRSDRNKAESDGLDCRLCIQKNTSYPTPAPTPKIRYTAFPSYSQSSPPTKAEKITLSQSSTFNKGTAALIGATIGAGVAVFFVPVIFYIWWKSMYKPILQRKKEEEEEEARREPPLKELSINVIEGESGDLSKSFEVESCITNDDFFDQEDSSEVGA